MDMMYNKETKAKSKGKTLWFDNGQRVKSFKLTQQQYGEFQEACNDADRREIGHRLEELVFDVVVRKRGKSVRITVERRKD